VCATSKETGDTVSLTSYRTPYGNSDLLDSVMIWEACRATSAVTSFFDPIAVGRYDEEFVDGATGADDPIREMWGQAQLAWGLESLEGEVKCLVTIGTSAVTHVQGRHAANWRDASDGAVLARVGVAGQHGTVPPV
jgi:predicted acylesterase/phospholipase RssA